jgi:hypothetical protein
MSHATSKAISASSSISFAVTPLIFSVGTSMSATDLSADAEINQRGFDGAVAVAAERRAGLKARAVVGRLNERTHTSSKEANEQSAVMQQTFYVRRCAYCARALQLGCCCHVLVTLIDALETLQ